MLDDMAPGASRSAVKPNMCRMRYPCLSRSCLADGTLCGFLTHPEHVQVTQGGDLIAKGRISVVQRKEPPRAAAASGHEGPVSEGVTRPEPPTAKVADPAAVPQPAQV